MVPVSGRYNALYGVDDFHQCMLRACLLGRSVSSSAAVPSPRRLPGALWVRHAIHGTDEAGLRADCVGLVSCALDATVTGEPARRGITVAIDKHHIPRHDGGTASTCRAAAPGAAAVGLHRRPAF